MGDIVEFTGPTKGRIDPDVVVSWASGLEEAIVIGVQKNGDLYVAGADADVSRTIHLLLVAQKYMLELSDNDLG